MKIENINVNEIKVYARNPRKNDAAVDAVAESIKEFGAIVPLVLDESNVIVAGHTRLRAARKLGLKTLPCVRTEGLTSEQIKAYRLADNKVSEASDWDLPMLQIELDELEEETRDMLDRMGFGDDYIAPLVIEDASGEIDMGDFSEDAFEYECQECGFRFNGK